MALAGNGKTLFVLTSEPKVTQLDTQTLVETKNFPTSDFDALTVSPNDRYLLLSNQNGRIATYDLRTGQLVRQVIMPFSASRLVFSPDGKRLCIDGVVITAFAKP